LGFVGAAIFLPGDDPHAIWRLLTVGLFGLGGVVQAWILVRPQRLTLDAEGFTLSGGLMRSGSVKTIPWRDVEEFFVWRSGRGNKMIALNFQPDASERTGFARFSRAFGADGALPSEWSERAEKMVDELNAYREQALQMNEKYGTPSASPPSVG
jgi:hypothetical protein